MFNQALKYVLSALLLLGGFTANASAGVIGTEQALSISARASSITQIQALIMREDIQQALIDMGVNPGDASLRAASLGDHELVQLQGQLESLPAGGSALAVIGVVFLVLMILEFTGVIDIFKKA